MGVSSDVVQEVQTALSRNMAALHCSLDFLSTKHKEDKYFESHPLAVNPETVINFGPPS